MRQLEENDRLLKNRGIDSDAEKELVESNMGLVYSIVKRFVNRGVETEDLIQIGALGLVKAVKKFDTSFNVKFSTYAVPVIIGEIKRYIRDDNPVKVSRTLKELAIRGKGVAEQLRKNMGREPTISEIADKCGVSSEMLSEAFSATVLPSSLYEPARDDDKTTQIEKIPSSDTEQRIIDKLTIAQMLKNLKIRERQVIILRYFKDFTQIKTAEIIGVSQVQVSRIEKKALEKIRAME